MINAGSTAMSSWIAYDPNTTTAATNSWYTTSTTSTVSGGITITNGTANSVFCTNSKIVVDPRDVILDMSAFPLGDDDEASRKLLENIVIEHLNDELDRLKRRKVGLEERLERAEEALRKATEILMDVVHFRHDQSFVLRKARRFKDKCEWFREVLKDSHYRF